MDKRDASISPEAAIETCPLCGASGATKVQAGVRNLAHCPCCDLVFAPVSSHPSVEQARQRYLQHENSLKNQGYVTHLNRAMEILRLNAPGASKILDYGAGPAPVLVELLRAVGFTAHGYDPLFEQDSRPEPPFDAVVAVESFEHFASPAVELDRIVELLAPNGSLILTTRHHTGPGSFTDWWYTRDITHVSFYSRATFDYIANRWRFDRVAGDDREWIALRRI